MPFGVHLPHCPCPHCVACTPLVERAMRDEAERIRRKGADVTGERIRKLRADPLESEDEKIFGH